MGCCNCVSIYEVHQASYLTMKGWVLEYSGGDWVCEGFEQKINSFYSNENEVTKTFSLEEAYDAQMRSEGKW